MANELRWVCLCVDRSKTSNWAWVAEYKPVWLPSFSTPTPVWNSYFRVARDPGGSGIVPPSRPYSYAISHFKIVIVSNCEQYSHGCKA